MAILGALHSHMQYVILPLHKPLLLKMDGYNGGLKKGVFNPLTNQVSINYVTDSKCVGTYQDVYATIMTQ